VGDGPKHVPEDCAEKRAPKAQDVSVLPAPGPPPLTFRQELIHGLAKKVTNF
jgi:hypothetical protein